MAKRGGKAATRRQRQRAANRSAPRPSTPAPAEPRAASTSAASEPATVEAVTAPVSAPTPSAASVPAGRTPRRGTAIATELYGSSRLSEKAAAEYHYVVADLRNILVLSAVLAGLLVVAFVAVNVLGIGKVV